jgi:hypothetical protein
VTFQQRAQARVKKPRARSFGATRAHAACQVEVARQARRVDQSNRAAHKFWSRFDDPATQRIKGSAADPTEANFAQQQLAPTGRQDRDAEKIFAYVDPGDGGAAGEAEGFESD